MKTKSIKPLPFLGQHQKHRHLGKMKDKTQK